MPSRADRRSGAAGAPSNTISRPEGAEGVVADHHDPASRPELWGQRPKTSRPGRQAVDHEQVPSGMAWCPELDRTDPYGVVATTGGDEQRPAECGTRRRIVDHRHRRAHLGQSFRCPARRVVDHQDPRALEIVQQIHPGCRPARRQLDARAVRRRAVRQASRHAPASSARRPESQSGRSPARLRLTRHLRVRRVARLMPTGER